MHAGCAPAQIITSKMSAHGGEIRLISAAPAAWLGCPRPSLIAPLVAVLLIALIGVVNLYGATSVSRGSRADLYVTQLYWLVAGSILGNRVLRKEDPKFPKTNAGFTYPYGPSRSRDEDGNLSGEKEGVFLIKAKRRCQYTDKRGDLQDQRPVAIVDSFGEPFKLTDEIPGGSIVRISYDLFAFAKGGNAGVSAGLQGVQIKSLGAGSSGSMFGTLDTEGEDIAD
jgi:hypothetical protein